VRSELDIMDPNFTAQMEEELDEVGAGHLKRTQLLGRFYKRFRSQLDKSKKLASWKPKIEKTDIVCEECGAKMQKKWGKNGWFLSCETYPKCKSTRDLAENGAPTAVRETDIICDKCGRPMVIKTGRFGDFLSCTGYPGCKNARPVPLGVACPACGGDLIEVRARKRGGRTFYGCSNFNAEQKCEYKLWAKPIDMPCPQCGAKFLTRPAGKKPLVVCADKQCGYKRELDDAEVEALNAAAANPVLSSSSSSGGAPPPPRPIPPDGDGAPPKATPPTPTPASARPARATPPSTTAKATAKRAARARPPPTDPSPPASGPAKRRAAGTKPRPPARRTAT
jgi:DNA topoisomerase-1